MRILITNDDGIAARGLESLTKIAAELSDDVWTVAPETNQSGTSHSMTLHQPLRCREVGPRKFAVSGTPTDCVIMAVRHIMKDAKPDLVLSGVNHGSNLGEDVTYSGTVAAAMEGALLGIPSIALSLMMGFYDGGSGQALWETAEVHGPKLIQDLIASGIPKGGLINVNFPDLPYGEVRGISVCAQGRRDQALLTIDSRSDPWGTPYFWFGFERRLSTLVPGTDLAAIADGMITVTPLSLDLTDRVTAETLAVKLRPKAARRA